MAYSTVVTNTSRKAITLPRLIEMHAQGEKIAMLTCYDASFAALLDHCGVEAVLIGDSMGMVLQGLDSTVPVTVSEIAYHTRCVAKGTKSAWIIADLPFGSYHVSKEQAFSNATELMRAGAQMVKMEGGSWLCETVHFLTERGIPVCSHLGLTPQTKHALGGYRVQGRTAESAAQLKADALALEAAGARMLVFEMIPAGLAEDVTHGLGIPTIGIGAGPGCSGQVLVLHDMLGVYPGKLARFVRNFMVGQASIEAALRAYVAAVKDGSFPATEHTY
ncbi:MAG: 3-methyl-2-oxobutanoate hydroxymethyltransferase [Burkholderiaceae bacterium]|jgi:3-methyl-2-oxobutanoate hydroxymethyltransferase